MAEKKKQAAQPLKIAGNIPVFVPKESKGDDTLYVKVNGVGGTIQKGKTVYVSEPFAELINNSFAQQAAAERFIAENAEL